jgi:hypothetical protein
LPAACQACGERIVLVLGVLALVLEQMHRTDEDEDDDEDEYDVRSRE